MRRQAMRRAITGEQIQALPRRAWGALPRLGVALPAGARRRVAAWRERGLGDALAVPHTRRLVAGYAMALAGIALATLLIGAIKAVVAVESLSLVYLPVVSWLAVRYGRGPAIAASALAFLCYDFFFVPPLHRLDVADSAQWMALGALLVVALVLSQLASAVQASAEEAQRSQQRTASLYALAQRLSASADQPALWSVAASQALAMLRPLGVEACALAQAGAQRQPIIRAVAPAAGPYHAMLAAPTAEDSAQATWALAHGVVVGGARSLSASAGERLALVFCVPLRTRGRVVGVLVIAGRPEIRALLGPAASLAPGAADAAGEELGGVAPLRHPESAFFIAVADQIAVALDRAELQQQAVHAEALRESDRLKTALLGSVTHDLRTPLAAITAATTSLLDHAVHWREQDRQTLIQSIDESANRLNRLVSNLLDLSRLEAGVAVPDRQWYALGDVIATVLDRLELSGLTAGRQIAVEVPEEVPLLAIDHVQMEQVLTNLIENALKYSPPESPVMVEVSGAPADQPDMVILRVSDHGIGIAPGDLERIFEKFYRGQQPRLPWAEERLPAGTGLGLAICKAMVEAHGGHIWAESGPGAGATIVVTLPVPSERPRGQLPEIGDMPDATAPAPGVAPQGSGYGVGQRE